ncbi:hypothetical protein CC78DRAFT_582252 [Lojkania enalia]|uniref:Uncharacterized protein n=1 Tax=Lojkania enalia TaxID=147567 RepID=A0A9P4K629_9PLEO|nr:hypothetical protein CC78DRAFT_582252 [Didymosphaeria enalia]
MDIEVYRGRRKMAMKAESMVYMGSEKDLAKDRQEIARRHREMIEKEEREREREGWAEEKDVKVDYDKGSEKPPVIWDPEWV